MKSSVDGAEDNSFAPEYFLLSTVAEFKREIPDFYEAYLAVVHASTRTQSLSNKVRELIMIAINVAVTYRNVEEARRHINGALKEGATREEILEVCMLVSFLGTHAANVACPMLIEEMSHESGGVEAANNDDRLREVKDKYIQKRGGWSALLDPVLNLDPDFCEAYINLANAARSGNHLPVAVRELIAIGIDASTTHLYEPGLRFHIRNALNAGVSRAEIVETIELVSCIGVESVRLGLDLLAEQAGEPAVEG